MRLATVMPSHARGAGQKLIIIVIINDYYYYLLVLLARCAQDAMP
jgi:hypothetical protein